MTLANAVQSEPGVYALLLGSGISRAAEIPTGWEVVTDLVKRAAAATDPEDSNAPEVAAGDPAAWWAKHGDGKPLGYSNLLSALGSTPAVRRDLIRSYFEPTEDEIERGAKGPTSAHRSIAKLVQRGYIRVIVTTNFDRLMERALEDEGISPQVISRPESLAGSAPLQHSPITIIKLHGDYAELDIRNTVDELRTYPPEWNSLLDRLGKEYGLLISGWSADWDLALVDALDRRTNRRYPIFWDERSSKGNNAQRLCGSHLVSVIPSTSADELFSGLVDRVDALERLKEAPLSTAVAVARLKRYLPDPRRHIDLEELVFAAVDDLAKIAEKRITFEGADSAAYDRHLAELKFVSEPLISLLATGVYYDTDESHAPLWVDSLQRLMDARTRFTGTFTDWAEKARHYPAALALRAMGVAAVARGHDGTLMKLLREATWRHEIVGPANAIYWLHDYNYLNVDGVKSLPRWNNQNPRYPISRLLRDDLREVLTPLMGSASRYEDASSDYEYRLSIVQYSMPGDVLSCGTATGLYCGETAWSREGNGHVLTAESKFVRYAALRPDDWPLWPTIGGREKLDEKISSLRVHLWDLYMNRRSN
nr:SIR2-like domain-containing protein [Cryobacterium sp.]